MKVNGPANSFIERITKAIGARTGNRVKGLKVEIQNHKPEGELPVLLVKGVVSNYHVKQLAISCVDGILRETPTKQFEHENVIEVNP